MAVLTALGTELPADIFPLMALAASILVASIGVWHLSLALWTPVIPLPAIMRHPMIWVCSAITIIGVALRFILNWGDWTLIAAVLPYALCSAFGAWRLRTENNLHAA